MLAASLAEETNPVTTSLAVGVLEVRIPLRAEHRQPSTIAISSSCLHFLN
jgi:hypothetical protein